MSAPLTLFVTLLLVCIIAVTATVDAVTVAKSTRPKLKYSGMTYTADRYCPNVTMSSPRGKDSLDHLATTGANFVSVVVTQYQHLVNTTDIFPLHEPIRCSSTPNGYCVTTTDADLRETIHHAHKLGMGVMLKLQIDLIDEPNSGIWRGFIGTNMTEADWAAWFVSYTDVLSHYATMANETGVEMFSVSCELVTASKRATEWREVVKTIRKIYTAGLLTDAANWAAPGSHGELTDKTWWDAVDVIGVDEYYVEYFNHTKNAEGQFPSLDELLKIWAPVEKQLEAMHLKWNKTIIFSEIGYCAGVNGSCFQNMVEKDRPVPLTSKASLESQAIQYEAALMALSKYSWFEGVFWWNWATDAAFGGDDNACMDPKFKPAEDVLRKWYHATEPKPKKPSYAPICECWL